MTALATRRPRGLAWSLLAVHRTVLCCWLVYVALAAVALLVLGFHPIGAAEYPAACLPQDPACAPEAAWRVDHYAGLVADTLRWLPLAVAAFSGAALVGREMENGTAALAWTQSVSPLRWLITKLTLPAIALVGGTSTLTLLFSWVRQRQPQVTEWFYSDTYLATGPAATAYVLLALAAGAVAGLLLRRALSALALAVGGTGAVMLALDVFRVDLWPAVMRTGFGSPGRVLVVEKGGVTASGERFPWQRCVDSPTWETDLRGCLEHYDAEWYVLFHPESHFWPLQGVETGIVLGLTALLVSAAFRLMRRRLP